MSFNYPARSGAPYFSGRPRVKGMMTSDTNTENFKTLCPAIFDLCSRTSQAPNDVWPAQAEIAFSQRFAAATPQSQALPDTLSASFGFRHSPTR